MFITDLLKIAAKTTPSSESDIQMNLNNITFTQHQHITYSKKTSTAILDGREITLVNSIPQYDKREKEKAHTEIEQGLYQVFTKYVS
ncbi:hypothetical protein A4V00_17510 [Hungateiclostridiaceae bacterium KB18]|nr:hypothetical protein A4V00_17510 [Hungateiclostridiaceae bacterium KB18]